MIKLTHYRKEVIYQVISSFFKEELKKAGIIYTEAPDLTMRREKSPSSIGGG